MGRMNFTDLDHGYRQWCTLIVHNNKKCNKNKNKQTRQIIGCQWLKGDSLLFLESWMASQLDIYSPRNACNDLDCRMLGSRAFHSEGPCKLNAYCPMELLHHGVCCKGFDTAPRVRVEPIFGVGCMDCSYRGSWQDDHTLSTMYRF